MKTKVAKVTLTAVVVLCFSTFCLADILTYNFTGSLDVELPASLVDPIGSTLGNSVAGTFSYDTDASPLDTAIETAEYHGDSFNFVTSNGFSFITNNPLILMINNGFSPFLDCFAIAAASESDIVMIPTLSGSPKWISLSLVSTNLDTFTSTDLVALPSLALFKNSSPLGGATLGFGFTDPFFPSVRYSIDTIELDESNPVPEPTSLLLFGTGLGALGLVAYRLKRK
ncbi:MAG: PEP-CTERM sorting domain-containing protein [Acidobacteria bacterium]|nr:PEP-CTERM sorting domain-containing protein [Acidobacteriota bacterium]